MDQEIDLLRVILFVLFVCFSVPTFAVNLYPVESALVSTDQPASKSVSVKVVLSTSSTQNAISEQDGSTSVTGNVIRTTTITKTTTSVPAVKKARRHPKLMQKPLFSWMLNSEGQRDIKNPFRKTWFNVESVVARGDFRAGYEIPNVSEWTTVFEAHLNPNQDFVSDSGSAGLLVGPRYYLDQQFHGPFVQFLGGFNAMKQDFSPGVQALAGYALPWRDTVGFEMGMAAERFFADDADARVRMYLTISFGVDRKLLPFL
ncbi:MAG: hypothetical protein O3A01_08175 [bacterium]|nr:hypothetical protein [bacterium]